VFIVRYRSTRDSLLTGEDDARMIRREGVWRYGGPEEGMWLSTRLRMQGGGVRGLSNEHAETRSLPCWHPQDSMPRKTQKFRQSRVVQRGFFYVNIILHKPYSTYPQPPSIIHSSLLDNMLLYLFTYMGQILRTRPWIVPKDFRQSFHAGSDLNCSAGAPSDTVPMSRGICMWEPSKIWLPHPLRYTCAVCFSASE